MNFSEIIKDLRKSNGFSAKDLAEKINFSNSIVYDWEKGRAQPNIETLQKLADVFECSIDYLVGREDDLGNVNVHGAELPPAEQEILSLFRSLGPFEREAILIQMRALSESKIETIKK